MLFSGSVVFVYTYLIFLFCDRLTSPPLPKNDFFVATMRADVDRLATCGLDWTPSRDITLVYHFINV